MEQLGINSRNFTEGNLPSTADYDTVSIEFGTHANFSVLPKRGGLFSKKKELPIDLSFQQFTVFTAKMALFKDSWN